MKKFLFFDVETNGLPKNYKGNPLDLNNWPEVLSIAWIFCYENGDLISEHYSVLNRSQIMIWDDKAVETHGITREKSLSEGKPAAYIFGQFLNDLSNSDVVVCHNTGFDIPVLICDMLRAGNVNVSGIFEKKRQFCTMLETADYWGKWPKLMDLFIHCYSNYLDLTGKYKDNDDFLKEMNPEWHNAKFDVWACAFIFFEVMSNPAKYKIYGNDTLKLWKPDQRPKVDMRKFQLYPFA